MQRLGASNSGTGHSPHICHVCSPVREHAKQKFGDELYWGFTEEDAVRYFMSNLRALHHPTGNVVLRPHPSEQAGKYDWVPEEFGSRVSIGGSKELLDEVAASDIVVGYNSMAMVIGLIAGKRVVNALPPGKIRNTLPMAGIEQLSDLLKASP